MKEDIKDDAPREVKELVPEEEEIEENVKQDAAELAAVAESMNKEPQAAGDRANHADLMISAKNQPDIPKDDPRLPKFIVVGVMKCGTGATQVNHKLVEFDYVVFGEWFSASRTRLR